MAGERVLDTVQVHPSDRDAGTLALRSADHDHRRMKRGNPRRQGDVEAAHHDEIWLGGEQATRRTNVCYARPE